MSSEIVLELDIIVLLFSIFIKKHNLKVLREQVCVSRQVELEIPKKKTKKKGIEDTSKIHDSFSILLPIVCFSS